MNLLLKKLFFAGLLLAATFTCLANKPGDRGSAERQLFPLIGDDVAEFLEEFRRARLPGAFLFDFRFEHLPRRGRETLHTGFMWGAWMDGRPMTRVLLETADSTNDSRRIKLQMLVHGGSEPEVWLVNGNSPRRALPESEWREPLVDELLFTAFDIAMPFIHWEDYDYVSAKRVHGRPAHVFSMRPPEPTSGEADPYAGIGHVEMTIDADFFALLFVRVFDESGEHVRSFKNVVFKQLENERYIVKSIDLLDELKRDKTRFEVVGARTDIVLPMAYFEPEQFRTSYPVIRGISLEKL